MSNWQPIETAPKDGTQILAYTKQGGEIRDGAGIEVVEWVDDEWVIYGRFSASPTHWMPLPEPPK